MAEFCHHKYYKHSVRNILKEKYGFNTYTMVRNGLHATMIENVDDCDEWWDDTLIVNGLENKSIGEEE